MRVASRSQSLDATALHYTHTHDTCTCTCTSSHDSTVHYRILLSTVACPAQAAATSHFRQRWQRGVQYNKPAPRDCALEEEVSSKTKHQFLPASTAWRAGAAFHASYNQATISAMLRICPDQAAIVMVRISTFTRARPPTCTSSSSSLIGTAPASSSSRTMSS